MLSAVATQSVIDDISQDSKLPLYESKRDRCANGSTRLACYILCVCVLFTFTAVAVAIGSAPGEPGDEEEATGRVVTEYIPGIPKEKQEEWKSNMFWALLLPSLIGVRVSLGNKAEHEAGKESGSSRNVREISGRESENSKS